jgi:hypothetical protein
MNAFGVRSSLMHPLPQAVLKPLQVVSGCPQLLQKRAEESFCTAWQAAQVRPACMLRPHEEQ